VGADELNWLIEQSANVWWLGGSERGQVPFAYFLQVRNLHMPQLLVPGLAHREPDIPRLVAIQSTSAGVASCDGADRMLGSKLLAPFGYRLGYR
jgi:hypothetical protein